MVSGNRRIVFLSFDGVLQPLGYSQALRPIRALAALGFDYELLTLERPRDLADRDRVATVTAVLEKAGVRWEYVPYAPEGTARAAVSNLTHAITLARGAIRRGGVGLLHARSYLAGAVANTLLWTHNVPYLFDIRGYWIDERIDEGRWFVPPLRRAMARLYERRLYRDAAAVVTLTEVSANDVRGGRFGRLRENHPVVCIPTCVDYSEFTLPCGGKRGPAPSDGVDPVEGRLIIAFLGALNAAYRMEETLRLMCALLEETESAHLLCLTGQIDELRALLSQHGIPLHRVTLRSVAHDEVARWLRWADWGFLLRSDSFANRAAMPTKLAEFLAAGVRPIQWGGNEDIREWVRRTGSGIVLPGLDEPTFAKVARTVAARGRSPDGLEEARRIAAPHFSLESGVDRYAVLLQQLLSR